MKQLSSAAAIVMSAMLGCTPASPSGVAAPPAPPPSASSAAIAQSEPAPQAGCGFELVPQAARAEAPAYLVTRGSLVRVQPTGATIIEPVERKRPIEASVYSTPWYFAGPRGTLWMSREDGLYALAPKETAFRKVAPPVQRRWLRDLIVRSDSEIWALAIEGEVASRKSTAIALFDGTVWHLDDAVELFGTGASPFALVATRDAVWTTTQHGLWRGDAKGWTLVDQVAPHWLHASQDHVMGEIDGFLSVRDGTWQRQSSSWPDGGMVVAVGASGLSAWSGGRLSSLSAACEPRRAHDPLGKDLAIPLGSTIDNNNRVWVPVANGLYVLDENGQVLADYRAGMLDGLTAGVSRIVVPDGGPSALPKPRERRSIDVVGRLHLDSRGSPLSGATIEVMLDGGEVRRATTDADGSFRLSSIPEGSYGVMVKPPAGEKACPPETSQTGFELWTAHDCPPSKTERRSCDVGAIRQCQLVPRIRPI